MVVEAEPHNEVDLPAEKPLHDDGGDISVKSALVVHEENERADADNKKLARVID